MTAWHCQTAAQTLAALQTDPRGGLDAAQVRKLQAEHGANELTDSGGRGAGRILWEQLSSAMVLLLIVAAAASALLGEITDTLVIVAIVVINAALGFVQDYRAERATMQRAPYPPDQHIFAAGMGRDIAWIGLLMALVSLALGYADWATGGEERHWRTLVFTVLTMSQMGNALATRSSYDSIFRIGWFSNPALIASVLLTLALQMAVIYWLPLQSLFKTAPLSLTELAACLAISTSVFWMIELHKWIKRLRQSHRPRPT